MSVICGAEHVRGVVEVIPPELTETWEIPAPSQAKIP